MKEIFIAFLKENKAYAKYVRNLKADRGFTFQEWIKLYRLFPSHLIIGAFEWGESPERYNYWQSLNNKWEQTYHD